MEQEINIGKINQQQFERVCNRLYDFCGIKMNDGKKELVQSRLSKRMIALKINSFDEYLSKAEKDRNEFSQMIDSLTTNKTSFFRENQHFDFLRNRILPTIATKRLRIWSSACSSGEEPYSISILLNEAIPNFERWDARILATDISSHVLTKARNGIYSDEVLSIMQNDVRSKYFTPLNTQPKTFAISEKIKKPISFARINLMAEWQMKGFFDVIFCRNVMIYFDKPTRSNLVSRMAKLLAPGGYLFVGHAESLTGTASGLTYIQPAIYRK